MCRVRRSSAISAGRAVYAVSNEEPLVRRAIVPMSPAYPANLGASKMTASPAAASATFWDKVAEKYAARPVADEEVYQRKLEITQEHFTPESMVLEFGCGTGSTAIAHAPFVKHILATDISGEMINIARGKAEAANIQNITFEQTRLDDLSQAAGSFDAVLGLNILHLLPNWEAAIAKSFDLLKPGGVFVTSTGCLGGSFSFFRLIIPIMQLVGKAPFIAYLSQDEVRDAMRRAGFSIEKDWAPGKGGSIFLVAKKPI